MFLRELAKKLVLTSNTARYTVEIPRINEALKLLGTIDVLLDAGAGGGHYAVHCYLPICRRLVALEYSENNFRLLEQTLAPYGERAQTIRGSATQLPLPDASVDCVTCTQVMEHIAEDYLVADEFCRVLKPGGSALITVPQPPAPWPEGDHVRDGYHVENLDALFLPRGFVRMHVDWFLTLDSQRICNYIGNFGRIPGCFGLPRRKNPETNAANSSLTGCWLSIAKPDSEYLFQG